MELKSEKSQALFERAKKVAPGGVHSPVRAFKNVNTFPRFMIKGEGAYINDVDGNRYVDYCMSWGPLLLGHADEEVRQAVESVLKDGWSFGTAEPHSLALAELITKEIPWIEKIRFVNSGTEAVMSAIRVARAATGRDKILKFDGCYHGHVDSMLVRAGSGLAEMASPDSAGVTAATAADTLVSPLDDLEATEAILDQHRGRVAAVIIEPVAANNGLLLQREAYLQKLKDLTHKYGALLIFDEVITGFRLAFGGVAELSGVIPDLVTYGKVVGGGFPVGAFAGRAELMDLVAPIGPVYQAGTLSANPVAMTAGLATLSKLKRLNPYRALDEKTKALGAAVLATIQSVSDIPAQVQQIGSIFWLALGQSDSQGDCIRRPEYIPQAQKRLFAELYPHMLAQGFYLAPSGFEVGFVSVVHTEEHHRAMVEALGKAIQKLNL